MECVGILPQEIRCATAHDNRVSFLRDLVHDVLHHRQHAVGVEHLAAQRSGIAFVAASPEGFRKAVQAAVHALIAAPHGRLIDISKPCNLFGEQSIPELPPQVVGELSGDGSGATTVLALDGDQTKHDETCI